jgi:hypothetical protein
MLESFDEINSAKEELKRADHLLYVTLKYTRTADVINNMIKRLASAFEMCFDLILEDLKKSKKIKEIPLIGLEKATLLEKLMSKDKVLLDYIRFYFVLWEIRRAPYEGREEYRKHIALVGRDFIVKTDLLKEYFEVTKNFVKYYEECYQHD